VHEPHDLAGDVGLRERRENRVAEPAFDPVVLDDTEGPWTSAARCRSTSQNLEMTKYRRFAFRILSISFSRSKNPKMRRTLAEKPSM
jgi:hypothetical protein